MGSTEKASLISRRSFLHGGSLLVGGLTVGGAAYTLSACRREGTTTGPSVLAQDGGSTAEAPDGAVEAAAEVVEEAVEEAVAQLADPREGFDVALDLLDHLHLADVDHHGVFIDFGTPGRFKYTLGSWRSGWGDDDRSGDTPFTWAGASPGRLYFHLDQPTELQVILRVRPRTSTRISVYVNDDPVDRVELPEGWSEQSVTVSRALTEAGENSLKLVHSSSSDNGRGFAIDYIRLVPRSAEGAPAALPRASALVREAEIGDQTRPALAAAAPMRLSWYLELPPGAHLGMSAGLLQGDAATATARLTTARGGEGREVWSSELSGEAGWTNAVIDLSEAGGQVARLDLEVLSDGEDGGEAPVVGLSAPSIMTRPARVTASISADASPRNVIVLLIDTLRADKLSVYGRTRVETPSLERFARDAAVFERCQAPANWTKPSCASVLTGLHPPSHRALTDTGSLPGRITMVSELFQREGFSTAALIANGYLAADFGFGRGWDLYRNYIRERLSTEAEHVFEEAGRWLEQHREDRSFLYIQTIDPHVPYDPPEEDLLRYDPAPYSGPIRPRSTGNQLEDFKRDRVAFDARDRRHLEALYDGEVTYHDRHFGRFIERLREGGLLDDTLFVITSDHGEEFFEHDSVGHGHSLYQELLHVPLMVRHPGLVPSGRRLGQVCGLVDIAPTILEAAGLAVPESMEGRSLVRDLRGAPPPMTSAAAFSSQWDTGNDRELGWTARMGDWKLRMRGPAITYLYDLESDPREQRDVDERYPIALRAARIALGQFLGAESRRHWASATPPTERPRGRPRPAPAASEEAEMTPELCEQLRALGYMDACR